LLAPAPFNPMVFWEKKMATTVQQYLETAFEHDAEYVDGRIVERPMPKYLHALMQRFLIRVLELNGTDLIALPEQRLKVAETRYRVPDICLTSEVPDEDEGILLKPPYLCVEILSPDDRTADTLEKVSEYLAMGVAYVWLIDPKTVTGEVLTVDGVHTVSDGVFEAGEIVVDAKNFRPN